MQYTALEAMYTQTLPRLVSGLEEWRQFVEFSARVRRPFKETALVYAQNPKATMVADYDGWKSCGRPVRFGEKGIAVLSAKGKRYVFDITQTGNKDLPPVQFLITQETRDELCTRYRKGKVADALSEMIRQAYTRNANTFYGMLKDAEFMGPPGVFDAFAIRSACHMVFTRFGIPSSLDDNAIQLFNSQKTIDLLGNAVTLTALPVIRGVQKLQKERFSRNEKTTGQLDGHSDGLDADGRINLVAGNAGLVESTDNIRTDAGLRDGRERDTHSDAAGNVRSMDAPGEQNRERRGLVANKAVPGDTREAERDRVDRNSDTLSGSESAVTVHPVIANTPGRRGEISDRSGDRLHSGTGGVSGMGDGSAGGDGSERGYTGGAVITEDDI